MGTPASFRIQAIVDLPILWPRFTRAPSIEPYPQPEFFFGNLTTSPTKSTFVWGLPIRLSVESYFLATYLRSQANKISVLTKTGKFGQKNPKSNSLTIARYLPDVIRKSLVIKEANLERGSLNETSGSQHFGTETS